MPWAGAQDAAPARFSDAPVGAGTPPSWRHETLPKVERSNQCEIVTDQDTRVLHVRSPSPASSLVAATADGAPRRPLLRWRWRVSKALAGSDFRFRQLDDYSARLYVLFDLPPERLSLGDRFRTQAARALSGREIPSAALCYA